MYCPSLLIASSPRVSAFSTNDALGRLLANASTIAGLHIPVHWLFLSSKYGLSGGICDSAALLIIFQAIRKLLKLTKVYESDSQVLKSRKLLQ